MKKQRGITLIVLVITIIVLLILAGVSIASVTGNDGMLTRAEAAVEKTRAAEIKEIVDLAVSENFLAKHTDGVIKSKAQVIAELKTAGKITVAEEATLASSDTITVAGVEINFAALETVETVTVTFLDYDGTKITTKTLKKGEDLDISGITEPTRPTDTYIYTFSQWVTIENSTSSNYSLYIADFTNIQSDMTVWAYYTTQNVCFVAGTKLLTEDGLINIEDVKIGMKVYSRNEITGNVELKQVTNTFENYVDYDMTKIYVNGEIIESTNGHKYFEVNKGWIEACNLKIGDKILNNNNKEIVVENVETIEHTGNKLTAVYNLEVEENHNYYVGETKVLVHNPSPCPV